jgi:Peptidase family S49 N-terminal
VLQRAQRLQQQQVQLQTAMTRAAVDQELKRMGLESVYQMDPPAPSVLSNDHNTTTDNSNNVKPYTSSSSSSKQQLAEYGQLQVQLQQLELEFVQNVVHIVGPEHAATVRTALLGNMGGGGILSNGGTQRPLAPLFPSETSSAPQQRRRLWLTRFPGDVQASQVRELREIVTAILRSKQEGDECLVVLQSGGGTVTGYGLAAAQLVRLKQAQLKLTIAVEQVAASVRLCV